MTLEIVKFTSVENYRVAIFCGIVQKRPIIIFILSICTWTEWVRIAELGGLLTMKLCYPLNIGGC